MGLVTSGPIVDPAAQVHPTVQVGWFSIVGACAAGAIGEPASRVTYIDECCCIGHHVVIYQGTRIGRSATVGDRCFVGEDVSVGAGTRLLYGAQVFDDCSIGEDCVVAGFCCERAVVGDRSRVFGSLIHAHRAPHLGWDDVVEDSPVVSSNAFVGFDAKVVGGVIVGEYAYVAAGAIVTRDVPSGWIACGVNRMVSRDAWNGELAESDFFAG